LQDMFEKNLSVYVTNAVTEVMARHMPGILHQESMRDKVCADQNQVAHLHGSRSASFPTPAVLAKHSGKQSDREVVAMAETMDCDEMVHEKMQDVALHKCNKCHAEVSVGANHKQTTQLHPDHVVYSGSASSTEQPSWFAQVKQSGKQSCKESNHVTVEEVERMHCDKILQHNYLVEQCGESACSNDLQVINSLEVCSSPLESTFDRETGLSCILPGWIPNLKLDDGCPSPINVTSVDSVRKASERKSLRSAPYEQSYRQDGTSAPAQKAMLENLPVSRALMRYWAVWGLLCWSSNMCSRWYRRLCVLISLCCTVIMIVNLAQQPEKIFENCAETAVSVSCLISLVRSRQLDSLIGHEGDLLKLYASSRGFMARWNRSSMRRLALFSTLWLCKAAAHIVRMFTLRGPTLSYQLCLSSAVIFQAGSYFATLHCAFHVTNFLELIMDDWTVDFHRNLYCVRSAGAWDRIQALLRRVARSVEMIFFAVQTSALIAIISCVARVFDIVMAGPGIEEQTWWVFCLLEFLPTLIMVVCALAWFAKATAVTEQSIRIPPVVNSLLVEPNKLITSEHQLFVSFIKNSDTGFYWKGCRLDATVFINYCYLVGAVICALFTTALKFAQKQ